MKQSHKTILLWVLLILMFVSIYNLFTTQGKEAEKVIFSQFIAEVEKNPGKIKKVGIKGSHYTIEYTKPAKTVKTTPGMFSSRLRICLSEY